MVSPVRETEMALTKIPVKITPAIVHTIPIVLATNDKGSRSPYLRRKHESEVVSDSGILGDRKRSPYGSQTKEVSLPRSGASRSKDG